MRTAYKKIQQDLVDKTQKEKKLKKRISTLRKELREHREQEKRLILSYERLIRDWRKRFDNLINNGWKIVFTKINIWFSKKKGKKYGKP